MAASFGYPGHRGTEESLNAAYVEHDPISSVNNSGAGLARPRET